MPPGVDTLTLPEVPDATTAVIVVEFTTENELALVPPNFTEDALVKFVPLIVTVVPVPADKGIKDVIEGGDININPGIVVVPFVLVTLIFPDAPAATIAVIVVVLTILKDEAGTPPKLTAVTPLKLLPVNVTVVPVPTDVGLNELTEGNIKNPPRLPVPYAVVTDTLPEAPGPTTASIIFGETILKDETATPPKLTAVVPVKLKPLMVTVVPVAPRVGEKELMIGGPAYTKPSNESVP